MELGCMINFSLSCKIMTALHHLKRVAFDLGGSPLRRPVSKMLQSLSSMLITSALYKEGNTGEIIAIPIIETNFEHDYIYIYYMI